MKNEHDFVINNFYRMPTPKKIFILVPALTARGGITNYYEVLKSEFSDNVEYFERGARTWPVRKGFLLELIRAWKDYILFKKRLSSNDIVLVQTNTSLGLNSIIRDGLFLRYARKIGLKTIVFFHGWNPSTESIMNRYYRKLFISLFFQSNSIIVLNSMVKNTLRHWGYKGTIACETTLYDKKINHNINKDYIKNKYNALLINKEFNILYLSRIEKAKGIYELIDAFRIIKAQNLSGYNVRLIICGDGLELDNIKRLVYKSNITDICIKGFVEGEQKITAFLNSHLYILPSHTEGMPVSVLEAMGFGLPVIATPVGGLNDFFKNDKNGLFIKINSPDDITEKIAQCIKNPSTLLQYAINNYTLANTRFRSDIVANRINEIHNQVLKENICTNSHNN